MNLQSKIQNPKSLPAIASAQARPRQVGTGWAGKTRRLVVIGASAGGINALREVLSRLPADLAAAIVIVQHLHAGHRTCLHEQLDQDSALQVRLAEHGAILRPGVAYLGVPGKHVMIENESLILGTDKKVNYVRPSVDILFSSAARAYGSRVIGVILSGTGKDGTRGCREIKAKGGVTIAQNEKTSRWFGMPGAAIKAGSIDYVLDLKEIAGKIIELLGIEN